MKLPTFGNVTPVTGRQRRRRSNEPLTERQYDVFLLVALHHLALPSPTDGPVLLRRYHCERFGQRTKRSMTLLVIGGSLSK